MFSKIIGVMGLAGLCSGLQAETLPLRQCQELNQPGVYKLTQDITSHGPVCFNITVDGVVLNLNNHRLSGPHPTALGEHQGIVVTANYAQISHGELAHFGGGGLHLRGASYAAVDHLVFTHNTHGVRVSHGAHHNEIMFNLFTAHTGRGLDVDNSADNMLIGNTLLDNQQAGIALHAGGGNTVSGNVALHNGGAGIWIQDAGAQKVLNNIAHRNSPHDLQDDAANCTGHAWKSNNFGTGSQRCIR